MSASSTSAGVPKGIPALLSGQILKILGLAVIDAFGILIFYSMFFAGQTALAAVIAIITVGINVVAFVPGLYPIRWMAPGFAMMILLVIYPLLFTVSTAFTNYSDGHLFSKEQAIDLHSKATFIPDDAPTYSFTTFVNVDDETDFALWLTEGDNGQEIVWARQGMPLETVSVSDIEAPAEYEGYRQLERRELIGALGALEEATFGEEPNTVAIVSAARGTAARSLQRYVWNAELNGLEDRQTDVFYVANDENGTFVADKPGAEIPELQPGYFVNVGFENFVRFVESPALRGPLVQVFIWTVVFAIASVVTTFVAGLFMALVLNGPGIPARKLIRSLLIIPYAIPGVISILVWRGMMNPNLGVLATMGIDIPWFSDPVASKIGILIINLWLGYPYMMLICSGALQSIPSDIYEAASVDGASGWQRFWDITLPLLLVSVGPLLIASFTYNFNNYVVIEAFNKGGPPIPGTLTPAGYTDILISYTYRLAFGSGRGADYGLASAVTIVIFAIVALVTLFNFRLTGQWEEVSENV